MRPRYRPFFHKCTLNGCFFLINGRVMLLNFPLRLKLSHGGGLVVVARLAFPQRRFLLKLARFLFSRLGFLLGAFPQRQQRLVDPRYVKLIKGLFLVDNQVACFTLKPCYLVAQLR